MQRIVIVCLVACSLAASACVTRGRSSQTSTIYTVEVANQRRDAVQVFFSDGGAERQLGTLGAGQSQRYHVNTLAPIVSIIARGANGILVFSGDVRLSSATTPSLTIR